MSGRASGFGSKMCDGSARKLREKLGGQTSRQRRRAPFLRMWPNGQFSLSYKHTTDCQSSSEEQEYLFTQGGVIRGSQRSDLPPNLVSTPKSSQDSDGGGRKSAKYGLKGITRFGSKMVRSAAYLLQRRYSAKGLTFLTLTVPELDRRERALVASGWGEVMRQVLQWLSRRLVESGQEPLVVSVTELQSARFRRSDEAYLHAHIVFPARKKKSRSWAVSVVDFRAWYTKLLERTIGRTLDCTPRVETKLVQSSVEGYLGKYMTKGSEGMDAIVEDLGEEAVPGQQWNMTAPMRSWVKGSTIESSAYGELMQSWMELVVEGVLEFKGYLKRVEIDIGGRVVTVAWVGNIGESFRWELGMPVLDKCGKIPINRNSKEWQMDYEQSVIQRFTELP